MSQTTPPASSRCERLRSLATLLGHWVRRDFRVRYTQTALGGIWAMLQPIALTAAFAFIFGRVAKISVGIPYVSFVFPGMLVWSFFSGGVSNGVSAMADSIGIAARARYPRVVAPIAGALVPAVDLSVGLLMLPLVLAVQHTTRGFSPIPFVAGLAGTLVLSTAVGVFLAALAIFVRDVRYVLPFALNVLLLLTPVAYPLDRVPAVLRWNPIGTFVGGVRSGVVAARAPAPGEWLRALTISLAALAFSVWYFHRVERRFPDVA